MKNITWILVCLFSFCVTLDAQERNQIVEQKAGHEVVGLELFQFGSDEYSTKSRSLEISLGEAKEKVLGLSKNKLFRKKMLGTYVSNHRFLVNDQYLFPCSPRGKSDNPISGIFVDGHSGEVVVRPEYDAFLENKLPQEWTNDWRALIEKEPSPFQPNQNPRNREGQIKVSRGSNKGVGQIKVSSTVNRE